MRPASFTLMFALAFVAACRTAAAPVPDDTQPVVLAPSPVLLAAPQDMRTALKEAYRLHPDRRFDTALKHLAAFRPQAPAPQITSQGGRWQVSDGATTYGVLSEYPTFGELFAALVAHAKSLGIQAKPSAAPYISPPGFASADAFAALARIQGKGETGELTVNDLHEAATWATRLAWVEASATLNSDEIAGHALAMHALAVAEGAETLNDRFLCLLEWRLQYTAAADECTAALPDTDPVRLLVTEDDAGLARLALAENATPEAQFSYASYLARKERHDDLRGFKFTLPLGVERFQPILESKDFSTEAWLYYPLTWIVEYTLYAELGESPPLADKVAVGTLAARRRAAGVPGVAPAMAWIDSQVSRTTNERLNDIGALLARLRARGGGGPFAPVEVKAAFYEGYAAAGVYHAMHHALDRLGSFPAAVTLAAELGTPESPAFLALADWYRHRIDASAGKKPLRALVHDLQHAPLNPRVLRLTRQDAFDSITYNDPRQIALYKVWLSRLDTRPERLSMAAFMAYDQLKDLPLAERMYAALVDADPWSNRANAVWLADFRDAGGTLVRMLSDPRFKNNLSSIADRLDHIDGVTVSDADYAAAAEANGWAWSSVAPWVRSLERAGNRKRARDVIQRCLDTWDHGWDQLFATSAMARSYLAEGDAAKAWEYASQITASYQYGAVSTGAWALVGLGRNGEAEFLFQRNLARYETDFKPTADYMRYLWSLGRVTEATAYFKAWDRKHPRSVLEQEPLRDAAREAAKSLSTAQLVAAADALRDEEMALWKLAEGFERGGNAEAAFRATQFVAITGFQHKMQAVALAYAYLERARGKAEAESWLLAQIDLKRIDEASMFFWRYPDILWALPAGDTDFQVWTLRAVYSPLLDAGDARRSALAAHFMMPLQHRYHTMGRAILGLEPESALFRLADTNRHRCEVSYYVAMSRLAAGKWEEASDWLRVTVETGSLRDGEFHWSRDQLERWQSEGKSLTAIRARRQAEGRAF
jgi:hypothetical protein